MLRIAKEALTFDDVLLVPAHSTVLPNTADLSTCLLYTSDAADDLLCVDLGGRRIIQKKNTHKNSARYTTDKSR